MDLIEIEDIDFTRFGTHISIPENKVPTKQGDGFKCWSFEGEIDMHGTAYIGVVFCEYKDSVAIQEMERHCLRKEILICPDTPIVLPLAKSIDVTDENERPLLSNIVNVVLRQGDVVIIDKGVWHAACYALEEDCKYYFIIENSVQLTSGDVWMKVGEV